MLGSNQRPQSVFPTRRTRSTTRPTIVRTGGAIDTSPDRLPLDHALTVGRQAMPGQVVLDHPNVSRRHAAFEVAGGNIVLRDLGGANGTYVNGARLRGARSLVSGDRIDIGPFELTFDGTALTRVWRVGNVELLVRGVSYDVPRHTGQRDAATYPARRQPAHLPVRVRRHHRCQRLGKVHVDEHHGR